MQQLRIVVSVAEQRKKKGMGGINGTLSLNLLACVLSYPESDEKIDNIFISVRPVQRGVQDVFSPA